MIRGKGEEDDCCCVVLTDGACCFAGNGTKGTLIDAGAKGEGDSERDGEVNLCLIGEVSALESGDGLACGNCGRGTSIYP